MQTTIFKSKKTGECYPVKTVNERDEIDINNPVEVDLSKYKRTGQNNAFEVYELKKQYHQK